MMLLRLPFPPSVNEMYGNNKSGSGRGRYPTAIYTAWKEAAGLMINSQQRLVLNSQGALPFTCRVYLEIHLNSDRQGDWDNRIKPICDLLKNSGIIVNDSKKYVKGGGCEWMDDMGDVECMVRITEAEPYRG